MNIKSFIIEEYSSLFEAVDVFHGTDQKFDSFNLNKIGSGDGRSLGGWGIYFSDDASVSSQYKTDKGVIKKYRLLSSDFFNLNDGLNNGYAQTILRGLRNIGVDEAEINEFISDYIDYDETTNYQAYEWLSHVLGGEKQASLFLRNLGCVGNMINDRTNPNATNYIVYDTDIIKYIGSVDNEENYEDDEY